MGEVIGIRLSEAVEQRYREAAANALPRPLPLATYLKKRLEDGDNVLEELAHLRRAVEELAEQIPALAHHTPSAGDGQPQQNPAMLIETLLLLRTVVGPDKMRAAHNEIKRLGLTPWDGK